MATVQNMPTGMAIIDSTQYNQSTAILPLPPAVAAKARTIIGTLSLAGAPTNITLQEGTTLISLHNGEYGAVLKYGTNVNSSNFDIVLLPGTQHIAVPTGVTSISVDYATSDIPTIIMEY